MTEIFRVEFFGSQTSGGVPVFSVGQSVHARVVLHLPEPMKAKAIDLHISGKAEVHWSETETTQHRNNNGNMSTERKVIPFRSEATYLDQKMQLWTSADQQIPAGQHIFPFQFTVPAQCPPSFEGTYGHIRYICVVSIDRPWKFNKKIKSVFVVSPFVDLNTIEWALRPIEQQINKSIGIFLFKHGKLAAKIRLPKSGFVPGERIPFGIEIDNGTSKEVKKVKAKLHENVVYVAQRGSTMHFDFSVTTNWSSTKHFGEKQNSRKVAEMEEQFAVAPQSKGAFQGHLAIPPCVPSFNTCPLIRVSYSMELKLETNATLGSSASVQFPLLIGTIPIRSHNQPNSSPIPNAPPNHSSASSSLYPSLNPQPNASPPFPENVSSVIPSAPPFYADQPPPSYEESVFGAVKAENDEEYSPRYPFYKNL